MIVCLPDGFWLDANDGAASEKSFGKRDFQSIDPFMIP